MTTGRRTPRRSTQLDAARTPLPTAAPAVGCDACAKQSTVPLLMTNVVFLQLQLFCHGQLSSTNARVALMPACYLLNALLRCSSNDTVDK